jgi:hypothetical protein
MKRNTRLNTLSKGSPACFKGDPLCSKGMCQKENKGDFACFKGDPLCSKGRRRFVAFAKQVKGVLSQQLQAVHVKRSGSTVYEYDDLVVTQIVQSIKAGTASIIDPTFAAKYANLAYNHGLNRAYTDGHKSKSRQINKLVKTQGKDFASDKVVFTHVTQ